MPGTYPAYTANTQNTANDLSGRADIANAQDYNDHDVEIIVHQRLLVAHASSIATLTSYLDQAVKTTSSPIFAGATFTIFPTTPSSAPTTNYQVANKKYVDDSTPVGGGQWTREGTLLVTRVASDSVRIDGTLSTSASGIFEHISTESVVASGNITISDDKWIGLDAAKGRIVFDDTPSPDEIHVEDANLMMDGNGLRFNTGISSGLIQARDTSGIDGLYFYSPEKITFACGDLVFVCPANFSVDIGLGSFYDDTFSIGAPANRFKTIYLGTSISDGTNEIVMGDPMIFSGGITASGNLVPVASGTHAVGTVETPWASGHFDNLESSGDLYAKTYYGDGSNLTGVVSSHSALSNLAWSVAGHTVDADIVPTASGTQDVGTQAVPLSEVNTGTVRGDTGIFTSGVFSNLSVDNTPTTGIDVANKTYVDSQVATENLWDRAGTELTTHYAGDDVQIGGNIGIGQSPTVPFHIAHADTTLNIYLDEYSTTYTNSLYFRKSSSNTLGTKNTTSAGNSLGRIIFQGCDTSDNFDFGVIIEAKQGAGAGSRVPTSLMFTTYNTTGANTNQFRLDDEGYVAVGSTSSVHYADGVGDLYVQDELEVDGNIYGGGTLSAGGITGTSFTIGSDTITEFSTDGTLSGDSDGALSTEKAVKTYVDAQVATENLWDRDGTLLVTHNVDDSVRVDGTLSLGASGVFENISTESVIASGNITASGVGTFSDVVIPTVFTDMTEPAGFVDRDAVLSFVDATRIFTITGDHDIYIRGVKTTKVTDSIAIDDATGLYWIYYDVDGALSKTTGDPDFSLPAIATIYYNTDGGFDKGLLGEERHGIKMDGDTHGLLHFTVGARYESGLTGTFGNTTFTITAGVMTDEDLAHSITQQTTCNILYKNGAADFQWDLAQTQYYKEDGSSDIYYNNGNALAAAPANQYVAYWIFATNDTTTPIVSLMGQRVDVKIADARVNNTYESLTLGTLPFQEMKLLYRVILRNDATPYVETQDLRSVSNLPAGTYVATQHNALTGLNWAQAGHTIDDDIIPTASGTQYVGTSDIPFAAGAFKTITLENYAVIANKQNLDIDAGTEVVDSFSTSLGRAATWDYYITKDINTRAGNITACWNSSDTVEYTETRTNDIGDTSVITFSVDIDTGNVRLLATAAVGETNWECKVLRRLI